jgi:hypothetical protein
VQCSAVQCSAVQCSAVQCSAVQCSAVPRCGWVGVGRMRVWRRRPGSAGTHSSSTGGPARHRAHSAKYQHLGKQLSFGLLLLLHPFAKFPCPYLEFRERTVDESWSAREGGQESTKSAKKRVKHLIDLVDHNKHSGDTCGLNTETHSQSPQLTVQCALCPVCLEPPCRPGPAVEEYGRGLVAAPPGGPSLPLLLANRSTALHCTALQGCPIGLVLTTTHPSIHQ